jgi:ankyrin repeat protein
MVTLDLFFKFRNSFIFMQAANPEIIDLLVQNGADVDAKDSFGNTLIVKGMKRTMI